MSPAPKPFDKLTASRVTAWLISLPWLVAALLRVFALDDIYPLIPAFAFTPWVAATAIAPLELALVLRVPSAAIASLATLAIFVLVLAPRALPGPQPHAEGRVLTVMTFNAYEGSDGARQILRVADRFDADVLSLQELTPGLVDRLRLAGLARRFPFGVDQSRPGVTGGGVWSRARVAAQPHAVKPNWSQSPEAVIDGLGVRVRSVHPRPPLSPSDARRWQDELAAMPDAATGDHNLRILAGDFNATLDHKALRAVVDRGYLDAADATGAGLKRTWPADSAFGITIDHLLVDRRIRVERLTTVRIAGSDHLALVARIRLP